jgi:hypothetical protein
MQEARSPLRPSAAAANQQIKQVCHSSIELICPSWQRPLATPAPSFDRGASVTVAHANQSGICHHQLAARRAIVIACNQQEISRLHLQRRFKLK